MSVRKLIYVTQTIQSGITFINANTDWKQLTNVSFQNGNDRIIVVSNFNRIRGMKFDGVILDPDHYLNYDWYDFRERFEQLGIILETFAEYVEK